jgi:probable F420-dependent oxidoreductase
MSAASSQWAHATPHALPERGLAHGLQLPIQSQSTLYAEAWEFDAGAEALREIARKADESGFFYIAVCDHVGIPRSKISAMRSTWYDTVATLGHLAAVTERVRLLSHVVVAGYRHPLVTAKAFMTLDELSEGRVILGIGAGHVEDEFTSLDADFAGRGGVTAETIELIRRAFDAEVVDFEGERFRVDGLALRPRPRQARLPIWVGGSSPPAIRRAARLGDGWLPQGTPLTELPGQIKLLRDEREGAGIEAPIAIGANGPGMYVGEPDWDVGSDTLHGAPERLAECLHEYQSLGVRHIQLRLRSRSKDELLDQMEAFHREVAPLLQEEREEELEEELEGESS